EKKEYQLILLFFILKHHGQLNLGKFKIDNYEFCIKENLEIESYFEVDDQYYSSLIKSYYYIKHNDFDKAFSLLAEINSINRLSYLRELIYLQCAIEKGLYDEAENIFSLLYNINKNNEALKKLYAYYLLRKGEVIASCKYLEQMKLKLNNDKEKTLYLYNLIESKQLDKAISYLKKEAKTEDKLFLLARLLHYIGILDEAFQIYEKIDEVQYPVNKMKGFIYFQLGKMDEALNSFNKEITVRFAETDLIKMIRYLKMKKRWGNASNSFRINI
ncbi:MAG: tetratricopeptide repeat protein, partial [Exilispira sp.]